MTSSLISFSVRRAEPCNGITHSVRGKTTPAIALKYIPLVEICSADPGTSAHFFVKALLLGPSLPPGISVRHLCNSCCQLGIALLTITAARDECFQLEGGK